MVSKFNRLSQSIIVAVTAIILFSSPLVRGSQFFVSPSGSNTNPGTLEQPFLSLSKAISLFSTSIKPGDTVWVRGGTYTETSTISISKSGTQLLIYNIWAYPGEQPLLDFSSQVLGSTAIKLSGSYCYIKGLSIKGSGDNGMNVSGSNNIIELCNFYENRDSGFQLSSGAANNKIINCDSYYNSDPTSENADGFACKLSLSSGNYFYGCRAWMNIDDGWDGYLRESNDISTIINNCWSFKNGYLKNGVPMPNGDGQGFKMGGSDTKLLKHNVTLTNCLAFMNKVNGFDQNSNMGSMFLYNCTAYANKGNNYYISKPLASGKTAIIKNCIELGSKITLIADVQQSRNSWKMSPAAFASDFVSTDTSLMAQATAPRKSDGSLPDITFMHLVQNSRFIDAGENVGLLYNGAAPDLGCFETGKLLGVETAEDKINPGNYQILRSYPNPFNPGTQILVNLQNDGPVKLNIYDINGQQINSLINEYKKAGSYTVTWIASHLASGVYICRLYAEGRISSIKMILAK